MTLQPGPYKTKQLTWACRICLSETLPFQDTSSLPSPTTSPSRKCMRPIQISTPNQNSLNILYTNCRSLFPKVDELRCLTSQQPPNIIFLCETWLDDTILDGELFIPSFSLVRRDRSRHGGGIAIFIHDSTPFKVLSVHPQIELLILELTLNSRKLSLALFYRPPSANTSILHNLEDTLDVLPPTKTKSLINSSWGFQHRCVSKQDKRVLIINSS